MFNFTLSDIKSILISNDTALLNSMLQTELDSINTTVNELTHKQHLIRSLLRTFGSDDISKQDVHEFISEQLYFKNERLIMMITSAENLILEIGQNLIPNATSDNDVALITAVKSLRQDLLDNHSLSLATMHIKDNTDVLNPDEFQIIQNNAVILKDSVSGFEKNKQINYIISRLKSLLV